MSSESLEDAFYDELLDVLDAEIQLVKALPKMAKAASSVELSEAILVHWVETKGHVRRAEKAFSDTGKAARGKTCEAMKGLITEAESILEEEADPEVLDALIIGLAQKVEHYEIATYGTLCTWAENLRYINARKLLGATLNEEESADKRLTHVSRTINVAANAQALN